MNWFEKTIESLAFKMDTPTNYGWFHITMLLLTIAAAVVLCITMRNASDKAVRRMLFVFWIVLVVLEVLFILLLGFDSDGETAKISFPWYQFPFQLCSTPLYAMPFVIFLKDSKLRDAFIAFLGAYSFFGGAAVMFYPGDVFVPLTLVNVQTMIHHGMQLYMGTFLLVWARKRLTHKMFLGGTAVFAAFCTVANLLNVTVHPIFESLGMDDTFNMFYISPYHSCTLPILSEIYPLVPYPVFLAIYVFGFMLVAALIYYLHKLIIGLVVKNCEKKGLYAK